MIETNASQPAPLDPSARGKACLRGHPLRLGEQVWILADYVPAVTQIWDDLFDQNQIDGAYDYVYLMVAATRLLEANYDVTPDESIWLIRQAQPADLRDAVELALFGGNKPRRTWGDWVTGSLAIQGLRMEDIEPSRLHSVLHILVATGRTVPPEKFISSAQYAGVRNSFKGLVTKLKPPEAAS